MNWVEHAIWWHVYPLGFCGAPIREDRSTPEPRLRRLLGWLDYAIELGTSGLLLGPIFTAQTHGYDTLDHHGIDPRLGTLQDFEDLLAACRTRGLRVLLDGVFSHVGRHHPDLRQTLQEGPASPTGPMFDIDWQAPGGPHPRVFEGHESLVRLNHRSPQTVDYVADVLTAWLDRGIDGWRLDAAYSVDPAFWAQVLARVRPRHPDAWWFAEVIHGDYAAFSASSRVDSVTQYELWKAIWSSLLDRNFHELDWALQRHNGFLRHLTPQTFIGNHDVTRIATTIGPDAALLATAILMTVGGIPSVYYGDEQAFTAVKEDRDGGDDAIRPAFPDTPAQLAPWGLRTYRAYQDLIGLRRRHPWLTTATTETLHLENTRYSYRARARDHTDYLDVHLDLQTHPAVTIGDHNHPLWHA
ncbi:alpha-amylase family protein [Pseudofrankia sp. BMG5.36]|uniref:alpha-amylase family protein n=1 Tax=Pseudofrankia sp. BMG5.36 TaxID=1834512 RepID=UPI0008DAB5D2|nr:alpha-amylase family protein [Pseudofrankia sp. BMG5.36]OHV42621.1 alpha-amylase [Pseudofrankia sp. BMG5.36]